MVYIVIDIETIAHPDAHLWLDPVKPDARLKDPEKIEASLTEKATVRAMELALHPDTCRMVALGYHIVGRSEPLCLLMRDEYEEREMLRQFWDEYRALDKRNEVRLVGFNSLAFDVPVALARSMYLDCPCPDLDIDKYRSPHSKYDVMWRLSRRGAVKPHSLKFYARRFGFSTLDKVDGSQIAQLVQDEDWNAVEAHCLSDVGLTHAIANRIGLLQLL